jgi:hypothetical protein
MPGDPDECRAHARSCAAIAERARTPEHRQRLKELEQTWLKLAADLEANQALLEAYPPPPPAAEPGIGEGTKGEAGGIP